jgi:hypothetical protein
MGTDPPYSWREVGAQVNRSGPARCRKEIRGEGHAASRSPKFFVAEGIRLPDLLIAPVGDIGA